MVASNYAYLKFSAYENIMSNKYVLSLLIFAFLVSSFSAQAEEVRTSLIETIAGAGDSAIPGRKLSFGAAAGLASDASGNIYFTLQALDRVYRLGVDGQLLCMLAMVSAASAAMVFQRLHLLY